MEQNIFNYDEWLSGHSNRKTMMQKLERSLVPFEVFEAIGMKNDKEQRSGEVVVGENTYHYDIAYDYKCIGHDVYDSSLTTVDLKDKWTNLLMGYNKFKVVMDHQKIKTIYSDHEDYFQQVIEMFEKDDAAGLYQNRSAYINNLLARYILLRLLEKHRPELQLLTTVDTPEEGKVFVMAASAKNGFTNATDAADYLVVRGVPFRDAHGIIGRLVLYCINKNCALDDLSLDEFRQFSLQFDEDIYEAISLETCVEKRLTAGAPGRESMQDVIKTSKQYLKEKTEAER
jgi:hypothetical protein